MSDPATAGSSPCAPIGWGELLDKIAILTIKRHRLRDPRAVGRVEREQAALTAISVPGAPGLGELRAALGAVNQRLWTIEDAIRAKEAAADFGPGFVALARAVYRENDERGRIKQAINMLLASDLVEMKQYSAY